MITRREALLGTLLAPLVKPLAAMLPVRDDWYGLDYSIYQPSSGSFTWTNETEPVVKIWSASLEREVMRKSHLSAFFTEDDD